MKKYQAQQLLNEFGLNVGYTTSQGSTIWRGYCYVITLPISRMNKQKLLDALKEYRVIN